MDANVMDAIDIVIRWKKTRDFVFSQFTTESGYHKKVEPYKKILAAIKRKFECEVPAAVLHATNDVECDEVMRLMFIAAGYEIAAEE